MARLEWQNGDTEHRLEEAEENNDRRQVRQIEIEPAHSARRVADRDFFRMPIPQGSSSRSSSKPAEVYRRQDLYARFFVLGIGRDFPEVMEENQSYTNSEASSSYRRPVDALITRHKIRVEEQECI